MSKNVYYKYRNFLWDRQELCHIIYFPNVVENLVGSGPTTEEHPVREPIGPRISFPFCNQWIANSHLKGSVFGFVFYFWQGKLQVMVTG